MGGRTGEGGRAEASVVLRAGRVSSCAEPPNPQRRTSYTHLVTKPFSPLSPRLQAARELLTLDEKDPRRVFEGPALLRRCVRAGLLEQDKVREFYVCFSVWLSPWEANDHEWARAFLARVGPPVVRCACLFLASPRW